jgi:autotransporter-associated beta strand protein
VLNAGTIAVSNNMALGTGTLAMGNVTTLMSELPGLTLANAITLTGSASVDTRFWAMTLSGVIADGSAAGSLGKVGTGQLTLSGTNTYTGATAINEGTLALTGAGNIASSSGVVANGAFDISGVSGAGTSVRTLSGSGSVTLGAKTLTLTNASGNFFGAINGGGGVTLASGTETLTGTNTYTGGTTITGGTLQLGNGGTTGSIVGNVTDNAVFAINHSDAFTFGGKPAGTILCRPVLGGLHHQYVRI